MNILVTGASGFIGHHLVNFLEDQGHWVAGVDYQKPRFGEVRCDFDKWDLDLREYPQLHNFVYELASAGLTFDRVYALAANMGGMGFISQYDYPIFRDNMYINMNTSEVVRRAEIPRLLFSSSACVYPERLQLSQKARRLCEDDAWKGAPDTWYGKEKLAAEELYTALGKDHDVEIRIARFHNIYGPEGSWNDGREKLPAAACRKVAVAKCADWVAMPSVDVWGDGKCTRSFCYITDCIEMLTRLMESDYGRPVNIGTDRMASVNEVFDIVAKVAGVDIEKRYDLTKPQGVRGRNADLDLMNDVLDYYEPQVSLEDGLRTTYEWVITQVRSEYAAFAGPRDS